MLKCVLAPATGTQPRPAAEIIPHDTVEFVDPDDRSRLVARHGVCARQRAQAPSGPAGIYPADTRGRALNLGFETGTLADWVAEGDAFKGQPVEGDTVGRRRGDMHSAHEGRYWVGTYEIGDDAPLGTLTSVPFTATKPFASFLVGGGSHARTCVELVRKDTNQVIFRASGDDRDDLERRGG